MPRKAKKTKSTSIAKNLDLPFKDRWVDDTPENRAELTELLIERLLAVTLFSKTAPEYLKCCNTFVIDSSTITHKKSPKVIAKDLLITSEGLKTMSRVINRLRRVEKESSDENFLTFGNPKISIIFLQDVRKCLRELDLSKLKFFVDSLPKRENKFNVPRIRKSFFLDDLLPQCDHNGMVNLDPTSSCCLFAPGEGSDSEDSSERSEGLREAPSCENRVERQEPEPEKPQEAEEQMVEDLGRLSHERGGEGQEGLFGAENGEKNPSEKAPSVDFFNVAEKGSGFPFESRSHRIKASWNFQTGCVSRGEDWKNFMMSTITETMEITGRDDWKSHLSSSPETQRRDNSFEREKIGGQESCSEAGESDSSSNGHEQPFSPTSSLKVEFQGSESPVHHHKPVGGPQAQELREEPKPNQRAVDILLRAHQLALKSIDSLLVCRLEKVIKPRKNSSSSRRRSRKRRKKARKDLHLNQAGPSVDTRSDFTLLGKRASIEVLGHREEEVNYFSKPEKRKKRKKRKSKKNKKKRRRRSRRLPGTIDLTL